MQKTITKYWVFSSSSGNGTYQTLLYSDNTTTCDCPGWTRRVAPDGSRSCKHTRCVEVGFADVEAERYHVYDQAQSVSVTPATTQTTKRKAAHGKAKQDGSPGAGYGQRKLIM